MKIGIAKDWLSSSIHSISTPAENFEVILKVASRIFTFVKSIIEESNPVEIMRHVVKSPLEVVIEVRVNFYYENYNLLVDFALGLRGKL